VIYELVVRSRAKADIRRAAKWYEKQRKRLGVAFVAEVDKAIARIESNPELRFPEQGERGFQPKVNSPSERT